MTSRKKKEDIAIYASLIAALICVVIAGVDYAHSSNSEKNFKSEVESAINEVRHEEPKTEVDTDQEPEELVNTNINLIVKKYFDSKFDSMLDGDEVKEKYKTWDTYEVYNSTFIRTIADGYYEYESYFKIYGKKAIINYNLVNELCTEEYKVIKAKVTIYYSDRTRNYMVKTFELL